MSSYRQFQLDEEEIERLLNIDLPDEDISESERS
jgi:hypothetical protein